MADTSDYPQLQPYPLDAEAADAVKSGVAAAAAYNAPPRQAPAPAQGPDNGILTDIGHGLAGGLVNTLPEMAGQALQAFTPEGSDLNKAGKGWEADARARDANNTNPAYRTTGIWGEGAKGVASAAATLAVGAGAALAAPAIGVGAGAVAAVAGGVAAAGLFGGSTFTDVNEKALAAGASPEDAHAAAMKAGLLMGIGQAAAAAVGGKIITGTGGAIADRLLAKGAGQNALDAFKNPSLFKQFGKNYLEMLGVQEAVQPASMFALNEIQQGVGINTGQSSWEAAKSSFGPTAAMTTLLSPLSLYGAHQTNQQRRNMYDTVSGAGNQDATLKDPNIVDARVAALNNMGRQMRRTTNDEIAAKWQGEAEKAIRAGEEVGMQIDFNADAARAAKNATQQKLLTGPPQGLLGAPQGPREVRTMTEEADANAARIQGARDAEEARLKSLEPQPQLELPAPGRTVAEASAPPKMEKAKAELEQPHPPLELPAPGRTVREASAPLEAPKAAPEKDYPPTKAGETQRIRDRFELPPSTPGTSVIDRLRGLDPGQQLDQLGKILAASPNKSNKWMDAIRDTLKKNGRLDDEGKPYESPTRNEPDQAAAEVGKGAEPQPSAVPDGAKAAAGAEQVAQEEGAARPASEAKGSARGEVIPELPGTTPVPDGSVRLYHQTDEKNIAAIQKEGLRPGEKDHAGNPTSVYASEKPFYGDAAGKPTVELHVPKEQVGANGTVKGSVSPENIIAAHMPWHETARAIEKDPRLIAKTLAGHFDGIDASDRKAVEYIKQKYGKELADKMGAADKELPAVPTHTGERNAAAAGKEGSGNEHQNRGGGGQAAQPSDSNRAVGEPPRRTQATVKEAREAVKSAVREQEVAKTAAETMSTAGDAGVKVTRSVKQESNDQLDIQKALDRNDRNLAEGRISEQTHLEHISLLQAAASDKQSIKKRGLSGLSDNTLAAKVAENPRAGAVMEHLAATHHNPLVREIAKIFAKANPNALISVVENADFNGGRYRPMSHTIEIGRGGMNPVTLMHETAHSLTHAAIDRVFENVHRPFESLTKQEQAEIGAYKTLNTLRDNFAKVADLNDPAHRLALENNHEFVSEAMSNPSIHAAMGGASKMRQFWNAIREMVGLPPKHQTDFEKLMQVAPTLFGSPNRHSLEEFHSAIDRTARDEKGNFKPTPNGRVAGMTDSLGKLDKLRIEMTGKWDTKAAMEKGMLGWTTYNNGMQWMRRRVDQLKLDHPGNDKLFENIYKGFAYPKSVIERKNAGNSRLLNAPMESNQLMHDMAELQRKQGGQMDRMYELARRVVQDPENAKNKADLARMRADPKMKEVSDMYDRMLQKNKLDFARKAADTVDAINDLHGFGKSADLDWWTHTQVADKNGDMRAQMNVKAQLDANNKAIDRVRAESAARLKAAGFDPNSEQGKTATSHAEALNNFLAEYDRQRAKPYVHLGRSGENMIHFVVGGGTKEWEAVRKIVNGKTEDGGLDRDMGPEVKGNRVVDMRFDNTMQHSAAEARLKQLMDAGTFKNEKGESTWASGPISERFKKTDGATPLFIRKLNERIDGLDIAAETREDMKRQINDAYLQQLPDSNPMKASMFADQTAGSSRDMMKTFGDRQTMANRALVSGQYARRMGEAMSDLDSHMKDMRESGLPGEVAIEMGRYANEIRQRVQDSQVPVNTPGIDMMRAIAAPFRLALSAAYLVMTAYQPFQMTLPSIGGRYGYKDSALAMARNYGKAFGMLNHIFADAWNASKGQSLWKRLDATANPTINFNTLKNGDGTYMLTGAENELANHLQMSGLTNFGQAQQIFRMDESATGKIAQGARVASIFPHYVEMANRIVSAFTAHEMALTDKQTGRMKENPTEAEKKYAREYAMSTIRDTDGDHSQGNIARKLGRRGFIGGATPLTVGFNQYDFQMTESLVRMAIKGAGKGEEGSIARKQLAGVALATSLMAGTLGMPFMGLLAGLYNRIANVFQDDADQPPDFEKAWADHMKGIFGEKGGEIVSRGIPRLFDIDMSTRSGYQDLAPFTSILTDRQKLSDAISQHALDFLGPAVGVAVGAAKGADDLRRGNVPAAINDALPAVARNFAKAYRMQQYGYERMSDGNAPIPIPVSTWNVIAQAGGFGGGAKAEVGEKQSQWDTNQKIMQDRNENNRNKWLVAQQHNDPQRMGEAMQAIVQTAVEQPQYRQAPSSLAEAYRQRMQAEALSGAMGGVHVGKGQVPFYGQFANMPSMPAYQQ